MDYCHPCHRHLNGALACPGCGTPADAVRACAEAVDEQEAVDADGAGYEDEPSAHRPGRRRRARRKSPRRKLLIAVAGVALVAGGIGVAELGTESPAEGGAQAAPDISDDAVDADADGTASPGADGIPASQTPPESRSSPRASASSAVPSPDSSLSVSPSTSPDGTGAAGAGTAVPVDAGSPAAGSPADPPATSSRPAPSSPRPTATETTAEPSPSETCDRFLWWCT
ncbi:MULTISPECIES: hypothetical protein [unclassified Streptomyces]|uniref:SCO2400 family protein n=1 Tax=unclassified Streptomyces TaxID=2593676 RepID=UPI000DC40B31|nr:MULTISPECIES: hypothetical protein [unclassified Streptomyces]MYT70953.1 hypothetical protein [Streptomyces sp. SID8367]RAJ90662.1 hypothetical protein K377_01289 [Streptomyces sp. PsTaAH-137]